MRGTKGVLKGLLAGLTACALLAAWGMEVPRPGRQEEVPGGQEEPGRQEEVPGRQEEGPTAGRGGPDGTGGWDGARLIGHSFGNVEGRSYTGCLEAFQERYEAGIRTFEVDFSTASDGKLVLLHGWDKGLQEGIGPGNVPSSEEFRQTKIYGKYTPLTFTDLLQLMKDYPDIWIVTDSKESGQEAVRAEFEGMLEEAETEGMADLLDRLVVQIYNEEMYDTVNMVYPFPSYIFTLYMRWDGDLADFENICRWCAVRDIKNITMWNFLYNEKVRSIAGRYGLDIFVHTENDAMAGANYLKSGVRGLYTDEITEDKLAGYSGMVKSIYFGGANYNAPDYVLEGISAAEGDFTWTNGNKLCFFIPVTENIGSLKVEMTVGDVYNHSQRYEVRQKGMVLLEGTMTGGGQVTFTASAENGFCKFEIILPDAVSPHEVEGTEDGRLLALLLKQVTLYKEG